MLNGSSQSARQEPLTTDASSEVAEAVRRVRDLLLNRRNAQGCWTGQLSTSALSTATACMALWLAKNARAGLHADSPAEAGRASPTAHPPETTVPACPYDALLHRGLRWLAEHQNTDGGWGDTVLSLSNISTTMLSHAVLLAAGRPLNSPGQSLADHPFQAVLLRSQQYIDRTGGVAAVLRRYGADRTFSVPILTHCALAGIVDWKQVIPLPFELACIPARWYAAVRMPVVSYALPALIAIGQVIFRHQSHWNPAVRAMRTAAIEPSLRVLESIQPPHGGFLEATPLTSFVCMSLLGCGLAQHPVTRRCLQFIEQSVRPDGSWPIDTNLTTWVTTLSVNALAGDDGFRDTMTPGSASVPQPTGDRTSLNLAERQSIRDWLLQQQYRSIHPYTNASPGGWSWTDLPGGVPDADDTPGAMLALLNLRTAHEPFTVMELEALQNAVVWLLDLQNRDGGWPTFCRGWGTLPFDRSSSDLTAHAIRALRGWLTRCAEANHPLRQRCLSAVERGFRHLQKAQRADGSWLPLWFGNQCHPDDENPLYGTAKVLMALTDSLTPARVSPKSPEAMAQQAIRWLLENQNRDGGWSGSRGLVSSVEETGLALEALAAPGCQIVSGVPAACGQGARWLADRVIAGTVADPAPIGFYFAKLWYFEELYPMIFAAGGLTRWAQTSCKSQLAREK